MVASLTTDTFDAQTRLDTLQKALTDHEATTQQYQANLASSQVELTTLQAEVVTLSTQYKDLQASANERKRQEDEEKTKKRAAEKEEVCVLRLELDTLKDQQKSELDKILEENQVRSYYRLNIILAHIQL